jgi:hypothetical protein
MATHGKVTVIDELPEAPDEPTQAPTEEQIREQKAHDDYIFRELRICLREVIDELFRDRKNQRFFKPEVSNSTISVQSQM